MKKVDRPQVTLDDCASEPIHVPGSIQPHGVMLVISADERLLARSENAARKLHMFRVPEPGEPIARADFDRLLDREEVRALGTDPGGAATVELRCGAVVFDATVHRSEGVLLAEIEERPQGAAAASQLGTVLHAITRDLHRKASLAELLEAAVLAVRRLTKYDRVMAYRFRPDFSGEVVAEARRADLEPFLGLRYPASDIPEQARRLYTLNPIRVIADVDYVPVPLQPADVVPGTGRPVDMSHALLRSVSPIHVEYLHNMGVRASMSISLVQDGQLWGLIACHHMEPYHPSHFLRIACLTLSDTLSLLVGRAADRERDELWRRSSKARELILARATGANDLVQGVIEGVPSLLDVIDCDGAAVTHRGRIASIGAVPSREAIRSLVEWLGQQRGGPVFASDSLVEADPGFESMGAFAGVLAAEFHPDCLGYVLWFRHEAVRAVRWAGNPEKTYSVGPLGPRLTPRGSFAEWRELAEGRSEPWLPGEVEAADSLREGVQRLALSAATHVEQMQSLLIGMLGHDLRNPLNAIAVSAAVLRHDEGEEAELGASIARSTNRMSALIASMLDYSRVRAQGELTIDRARCDLHGVIRSIAEETLAAYPGMEISVRCEGPGEVDADATRIGQLVSNLLSNARHHGDASRPVTIHVGGDPTRVRIEVANSGKEIPQESRTTIFDAFRSGRPHGSREGVGLGLFICREIARAHLGTIDVHCADGTTMFRVEFPRHTPSGPLPARAAPSD